MRRYVRIAKHKATGKITAIKAMSKGYLVSKHQVRHAIGERDLLMDCKHPGIVQVGTASMYHSCHPDTAGM